jgi:hypothetical protein
MKNQGVSQHRLTPFLFLTVFFTAILPLLVQLLIFHIDKSIPRPQKKPGFLRALKILSISRTNLYNLVKAEKIVPVKLGKRTLFTEDELSRFIDSLEKKD